MEYAGLPFGRTNPSSFAYDGGKKATQQPITTGTSVMGIKFDGGVLMAADMLGSYGSLARYRNVERLMKVNEKTVIAVGGDIADFQHVKAVIEARVLEEDMLNDGFEYSPKALHSWLTRVLYTRRSKFNPLWNTCVVGGMQGSEPYLGYVNMIGVNYTADCMSTGFGGHLGVPQLREALEQKDGPLTLEEARSVMDRVLHILYYRDCRAFAKYQLAIVDKDGARIEEPQALTGNWELAHYVRGYE